ncbi:MAG: MarR family EPS-associated transcriptional regulator [Arcobacteraceae bacterium]|nr:MarR family EPS-associated transcriptional regulator [Arcobacteraceae bacterium]
MTNEELQLSILRNITPSITQKSLADELGYSIGKINYVLKGLCEKGLLKVENFYNNQNKKQYKYLLTQKGIEEKIALTEKFINRKKKEYDELVKELNMIKMENN